MSARRRLAVVAGAAAAGAAAGAVASAAAGMAGIRAARRARRWGRFRAAGEGIADALLPPAAHRPWWVRLVPTADESHAPGHQHLQAAPRENAPGGRRPVRARPFAKHRHGMRHPGRG